MARLGINTVRTYTPPRIDLLDEAARCGLRVMVGLPWSQHVAFLDDRRLKQSIRRETVAQRPRDRAASGGRCSSRSATRFRPAWCAGTAACASSDSCARCTRTRSPPRRTACSPTSISRRPNSSTCRSSISTPSTSTCTARRSCARTWRGCSTSPATSRCCWPKRAPIRIREGEAGQAEITAMHIRTAFEEGACGAIAFAWTDEWWRGGFDVDDWAFGLVDRAPPPEAGGASRRDRLRRTRRSRRRRGATWPRVSVVVCAYNAADTLEDCLTSLERLTYPDYEIILVNDGSRDRTGEIGQQPPARAGDRHPQRRAQRRAQRRPGRSHRRDRRLHRCRRPRRSRLADLSGSAVPHLGRGRLGRSQRRAARRSADGAVRSPARRAARRTCCSTIASPSTSPAATWRSAAKRCSRSAASMPSTSAPATTSTSAGACRRAAGRSASRPRRSSGITTGHRSRPTGGSRSVTAKARPG